MARIRKPVSVEIPFASVLTVICAIVNILSSLVQRILHQTVYPAEHSI